MKNTLLWLWQLRWWQKILLVPVGGFCYLLISGLYYTYGDYSKQDDCSSGTDSYIKYNKLIDLSPYGSDDFRNDFYRIMSEDQLPNRAVNQLLLNKFKSLVVETNNLKEVRLFAHAFMNKIGFSLYFQSNTTFKRHETQFAREMLVYKILRSKIVRRDIYSLITREPMTLSVNIEMKLNSKNRPTINLSLLTNNDFLSSRAWNFDQHSVCLSMH